MKKSIWTISALFLVACSQQSTAPTQPISTTTTAVAATADRSSAKSVYVQMQNAMQSVSSLVAHTDVTLTQATDTSQTIKTVSLSKINKLPNLTMVTESNFQNGNESFKTTQYIRDNTMYLKINDNPAFKQSIGNMESIITSQMQIDQQFSALIDQATLTEDSANYILTYQSENATNDAVMALMKNAMLTPNPENNTAVMDNYAYAIEKINYTLTIQKETFYSTSTHVEMVVKVTSKSSNESVVLNLSTKASLSEFNNVPPITIPEHIINETK